MITIYLLIANVSIYFLSFLVTNLGGYEFLRNNFFLWLPETIFNFKIWTFLTYMFFHDLSSFSHLILNMFGLLMFGREIEERIGHINFLIFYLFSGIGAGLLQIGIQLIQYLYITTSYGDLTSIYLMLQQHPILPVIGASGAIYGILAAYGMLFPERELLFFFVIPMKAWTAVIVFALIELFSGISGFASNIAHFAHLGGLFFGIIYIKYLSDPIYRITIKKLWKYERKLMDI